MLKGPAQILSFANCDQACLLCKTEMLISTFQVFSKIIYESWILVGTQKCFLSRAELKWLKYHYYDRSIKYVALWLSTERKRRERLQVPCTDCSRVTLPSSLLCCLSLYGDLYECTKSLPWPGSWRAQRVRNWMPTIMKYIFILLYNIYNEI